MGIVLPFQGRHATSAPVSAGKEAKASKVICGQPLAPAKRTISGQRWAGMKPLPRQVLTVEAGKPSSDATLPVPPKPSMTESTVTDIGQFIVRTVRTCQEFANCETTFGGLYAPIGGMIDPPEIIGPRLKGVRIALGFKTQAAFAKKLGIEKNTYNPFEKGSRPLTFEVACTLRTKFLIPLDFMFYGADPDRLPAHIYEKIGNVL